MINKDINYSFIDLAKSIYKAKGYKYIEVPWIVSHKAIKSTFDGDAALIAHKDYVGYPVASAEQSFVELLLQGKITKEKFAKEKYVAATPCFRIDENGSLHNPYFFKVELIIIVDDTISTDEANDLQTQCMYDARYCMDYIMNMQGKNFSLIKKHQKSRNCDDWNINNIEVGSYGQRSYNGFKWIYGTGLAEPRFSLAINYEPLSFD